jgi:hypothetical protein
MSAHGEAGPAEVPPVRRVGAVRVQRLRGDGLEDRPQSAHGEVRGDHLPDVRRREGSDLPELLRHRPGVGRRLLHALAVSATSAGWLDLSGRWHPTLRAAVTSGWRTLCDALRGDPACPICGGINSQNCSRCRG